MLGTNGFSCLLEVLCLSWMLTDKSGGGIRKLERLSKDVQEEEACVNNGSNRVAVVAIVTELETRFHFLRRVLSEGQR